MFSTMLPHKHMFNGTGYKRESEIETDYEEKLKNGLVNQVEFLGLIHAHSCNSVSFTVVREVQHV